MILNKNDKYDCSRDHDKDNKMVHFAFFSRDIKIKNVRNTIIPIEYPETSNEKIAYQGTQ